MLSPDAEPVRLTVELAPGRDPVEGAVLPGSGEAHPFSGWMELVAALESVLEGASRPAAGGDAREEEGE